MVAVGVEQVIVLFTDNVFVTTTVYCPPVFTVADELVAPEVIPAPVQLYETGFAVVVTITCAVFVMHVIELLLLVVTNGNPALGKTSTVPLFTQPFAGLVMVRVYILAADA